MGYHTELDYDLFKTRTWADANQNGSSVLRYTQRITVHAKCVEWLETKPNPKAKWVQMRLSSHRYYLSFYVRRLLEGDNVIIRGS